MQEKKNMDRSALENKRKNPEQSISNKYNDEHVIRKPSLSREGQTGLTLKN